MTDVPCEYENDDDTGFNIHETGEDDFVERCKVLAESHDFPARAVRLPTSDDVIRLKKKKIEEEKKEKEKEKVKDEVKDDDSMMLLKGL
jgi:hypothetical protein